MLAILAALAGVIVGYALARIEQRANAGWMQRFYERALEHQSDTSGKQAVSLVRMAVTGSAEPPEVQVAEREPDAHEVLARTSAEQTVQRGMDELRMAYKSLGVQVSDSDLREEVEALLSGVAYDVPREPRISQSPASVRD